MAHNTRKFPKNASTFWRRFRVSNLFGPNGPRHRILRKNSVSNAPFPPRAAQSPPLPRRKRDFHLDFRPNPSCRFSRKKSIQKSIAVFCVFVFSELSDQTDIRNPGIRKISILTRSFSWRLVPSLLIWGRKRVFYLEFRRNPTCRFSRFFNNKKGVQ